MATVQYVALLRGINVGGGNIIRMADLRACLEAAGLADVATYIQSGNVLFAGKKTDHAKLTQQIEQALTREFAYKARVVLRSYQQLREIVAHAPRGFGSDPASYRYDVIYLREPLTPAEAMKRVTLKERVDRAFAGRNVLYFARLTSRATQSHLARIVRLPVYQSMTIRNWNTTMKLVALMDGRADSAWDSAETSQSKGSLRGAD